MEEVRRRGGMWLLLLLMDRLLRLLGKLLLLDRILDHFLLLSPLLSIAPPHRSLVIALQSKMSACFA